MINYTILIYTKHNYKYESKTKQCTHLFTIIIFQNMRPLLLGKRIVYKFTLCAFVAFAEQNMPHRIHNLNSLTHTHTRDSEYSARNPSKCYTLSALSTAANQQRKQLKPCDWIVYNIETHTHNPEHFDRYFYFLYFFTAFSWQHLYACAADHKACTLQIRFDAARAPFLPEGKSRWHTMHNGQNQSLDRWCCRRTHAQHAFGSYSNSDPSRATRESYWLRKNASSQTSIEGRPTGHRGSTFYPSRLRPPSATRKSECAVCKMHCLGNVYAF